MLRIACLVLLFACGSKSTDAPTEEKKPHAKHEDRHEPATATPSLALKVHVDGSDQTWAQDVFDKVPHSTGKNNDGQDRDVWSLRDLVHTAVGPSARVVAVAGDIRMPIDTKAWDDPDKTPILHRTKRGALKFRWADKDGKWGDTGVKDVTELEVTR